MTHKTHLALVQPKTGPVPYTGAVLPWKPPIDKILALTILHHMCANEKGLEEISYWKSNECSDKQFTEFRDALLYPIDIGDRKYHDAYVGGKKIESASEFVVKEFGFELSDGFAKLLVMINENNENGKLRKPPFAFAKMLREMYELGDDSELHMNIIKRTMHVLESYSKIENGEIRQSADDLAEAMPDLVAKFKPCQDAPLTLGRYLRDLWVLGEDPAIIREMIDFWVNGSELAEKRVEEGKKALAAYDKKNNEFTAGGYRGVVIKTDDRFLSKAANSGQYAIRMIVQSDGHMIISTRQINLSALNEVLQKREPGRWYYDDRMKALMNGGPQYVEVRPTGLSPVRMIGLLQTHIPHIKKR